MGKFSSGLKSSSMKKLILDGATLHEEVGIFGQPVYFEKDFNLSSIKHHNGEIKPGT
jgi:hypothetical protein